MAAQLQSLFWPSSGLEWWWMGAFPTFWNSSGANNTSTKALVFSSGGRLITTSAIVHSLQLCSLQPCFPQENEKQQLKHIESNRKFIHINVWIRLQSLNNQVPFFILKSTICAACWGSLFNRGETVAQDPLPCRPNPEPRHTRPAKYPESCPQTLPFLHRTQG